MKEVVVATSNLGKFAEFQAILSPVHCISQQHLGINSIEETGLSFIENAIIKARHASRIASKPALADDSGIVVPALGGSPGIYSARFAGTNAAAEENNELLLERLIKIPDSQRGAYFYCALALVQHPDDPTPLIATGRLEGKISKAIRGTNGFGYDPIMYLPDYHCTVAELSPEIKNSISHRAHALQQLREQLNLLGEL
jgi:XTP/dITP diphosphohydrolase